LQTKLLSIRNRLKKSSDDAICSLQGSGAPILQVMRVVDGKLSSPVSIPLS
jgi:hypothetical protein